MQRMWRPTGIDTYNMEYGYSTMGYEVAVALGVKLAIGDKHEAVSYTHLAARHTGPSVGRTVAVAAASAMCGAMICGIADFLWNYPRVMCCLLYTSAWRNRRWRH